MQMAPEHIQVESPAGRNIDLARRKAELTQEALATRLGVRVRRLQRWISGDNEPPYSMVAAVGAITNLPVEWFYVAHDEEMACD